MAVAGYVGFVRVVDRIEKADDANRIIKWAFDARTEEKNYILRADEAHRINVERLIADIYRLATSLKARFRDTGNREKADRVLAASEGYRTGFHSFIRIRTERDQAESRMVESARELEENDARAVNAYQESAALLRIVLGSAADSIEVSINEFDFSAALQVLRTAKADLDELKEEPKDKQ